MNYPRRLRETALKVIEGRLAALGFRKREQSIFSLAVSENVLGLLGLNTAGGRGQGVLEINPVVGVRNQRVEKLVAELLGETFDEVNPFSAGANIGYLSPKSKYWPFLFNEGTPTEGIVGELVEAIQMWGLPFIRSNVSLEALLATMSTNRFAIRPQAIYRIPAALYLLGRSAEAVASLQDELVKLGAATDPGAKRFQRFANNLMERMEHLVR